MTYLIRYVDEGLGIFSRKTSHIGDAPVREDFLNKGYDFTLGGRAADQALQGSFARVENEGWSGGG